MKEVAIAILYEAYAQASSPPKLLMQLRDPLPQIVYPGMWGLFGGHLEPNESPEEALQRELWEEIRFVMSESQYFGNYGDESVARHIFTVPLKVSIHELTLQEGWDMALLSWQELQKGQCYSQKAKQVRPVGEPHLKAITDFFSAKA